MKKVENKFLSTFNVLIAGLLALLGFSYSCEEQVRMYGTPSAQFIVNGNIQSSETSEPIKNIRIIMDRDTAFTDQAGNYQVVEWSFPISDSFNLKAEDIDSTLNGEFEKLDTIVEFKDPKFIKGDGDWYMGETTKEFNIKLNPKE
jgi:putative lipoprotein (rSAM/lipoprotein system)